MIQQKELHLQKLEFNVTIEMYRLLVPLFREEDKEGMNDEHDVHEHEQVVSVPKGIESGQVPIRCGQLNRSPSKGMRCKCK